MPVSPKLPATLLTSVDYQAASLGSNQMGKESEYTFAKLSGAENYKEWAREMIFALKDSGLWGYVDGTIIKPAPLEAKEKGETVTAEAKQETQDKIDLWTKDDARALGKMGRMCNKTVQLGFDATWLSSKAWSELKTKYSSKGWSTKWDVLNRLEQTNYSSSKDINNLGVKIVKILEEIKELDISMEEMVTIKLMNGLGSSFETYLTMLSQKARDDNKLPDLQALLSNLEDDERRMKQTTKVNLAQSQNTSSGGVLSRGGSSSRARGGRGGRGQSNTGRGGGSGTTGGTSGVTGTSGPSPGSSTSKQNNPRCNACNYHHVPGQCPHANLECHVYGKKGHIHRNCPRKGQFGGQQGQNSLSSNFFFFFFFFKFLNPV